MTNANLSTLSLSELKAVAAFHGTAPTGDKRSKQSWISAIESYRAEVEVASAAFVAELNADEDDTFDIDGWDAPVTISDAETEAIAHAADVAPKKATKSLCTLIERELSESALEQTALKPVKAPEPAPAPKKVLNHKNSAVLIFGTLVCVFVLVFRVAFGMGAIAFKLGSYVVRLFGSYDPNLDLGWQFSQFRRARLVPATAM